MCRWMTKTEEAAMKEVIALFEEQIAAVEADTGKSWPAMLVLCLLLALYCAFLACVTLGDLQ